jgi:hypothetical protein
VLYNAIVKTNKQEFLKYRNIDNLFNFQKWVMHNIELNVIFIYDRKSKRYLGHWKITYPLGTYK